MAKNIPHLSKSEWAIMQQVWKQKGERLFRDIYEPLKERWAKTTVRTMIERLVAKGYLSQRKLGPICLYEAQVQRRSAMKVFMQDISRRVLAGSVGPLLAYAIEEENLTDEELAELKKIISKKQKEKKK